MPDQTPAYSLFQQPWWLDAACPDAWAESTVIKGGSIVARLPYRVVKRYGMTVLTQPPLTPRLGPWIKPTDGRASTRLAADKKLMAALIDQLPPFDFFSQTFHDEITNWLPFYWRGFDQTTLYSYVLDDLSDLDAIWTGIEGQSRTAIRKAEDKMQLRVEPSDDVEAFLDLNESVFTRQGRTLPYDRDLVRRIDRACRSRDCRRIFVARQPDGRPHAALYLVWDEASAYYLMGGSDPELRNSGAGNLLVWEAIRFAATVSSAFDFEGSMIEPIERFFRSFGGRQTPYSDVTKRSRRFALAAGARSLFSR